MTREEEIKRAWAAYRLPWPRHSDGTLMKQLNIARHGPAPTEIWNGTPTQSTALDDRFTFELEDGYHEGKPATRVVCEGVVVEISPRGKLMMKAANDNGMTKRSKRLRPGVSDTNLDYGRPLAWDAENDNEEPSDPSRYVALDGVVERRA